MQPVPLSEMKEWYQDQWITCTQCVHTQTHTHNIYMPGRGKKNNYLDPNNSCEAMSREY